ncbi:HAMP domain-containing sensor histidine kinase [Spirulina sp. CS-785/01]|uniref:sensor histidine kinase n=1 Tax=Spirulina sp. CS-785/01 TaxID=3021716 RepID=UPI00232CA648|nr:HAMP domain-containing sensor histidine kinase [Spirulina sp. CS-785/01]MDB9314854.1 HAMP domain-containing sensor histidine kinase [Spirulina sp. CS-785/01]
MVWGIGLIQKFKGKHFNPKSFSPWTTLRWRLLCSYLGVMVAILGSAGLTVYQVVASNLNRQLEMHLLSLAQTAAQSLDVVKHEYAEYTQHTDNSEIAPSLTLPTLMEHYDTSPLLIPEQNLSPRHSEGVEWFNAEKTLLVHQGNLKPQDSLPAKIPDTGMMRQNQGIRSYTLPVYRQGESSQVLAGYVRASESTEDIELELDYLRLGLGIGGIFALGITGVSGMWLTARSLKPIEQSFEQLKQFTADASHELRTPLTVINTTIASFYDHPERIAPPDFPKIEAIQSATEQMKTLVEDLLFLSRMEGFGKLTQEQWRVIPLEDILEDLGEELAFSAEQKGITLTVFPLPSVSVYGHPQQLKRLFSNILTNGVKYTPTGGRVTVSMERNLSDGIITCEDTGIGIAREDLPYIFDRFWQADQVRGGGEGTGLGMAIAQTIARLHYGQITVTSQLGQGSCFQVTLPLANDN